MTHDVEILVDVAENVDVIGSALFKGLGLEEADWPEEYGRSLSRLLDSVLFSEI